MMSGIGTVISFFNTNEIKFRPTIDEVIQLTAALPIIIANLYRKNFRFCIAKPRI